jgi:microcystin-dependent protein
MSDPFIGEIRMFGAAFTPRNWAACNGAILDISGNEALFSLIGDTYGGDGRSNFALPDLRGRVPGNFGAGTGLTPYQMGARFGVERVTLTEDEIPPHSHPFQASLNDATEENPAGAVLAKTAGVFYVEYEDSGKAEFWEQAVADTGAGQSHSNMMPFLAINFIICLLGTYPPRS